MPVEPAVDSPAALAALREHIAGFSSKTQRRGRTYFQTRRVVRMVQADQSSVVSRVRGSQLYAVSLLYAADEWRNICSCPLGLNCKHVYAVGLAWLAKNPTPEPAATKLVSPPRVTFRQQWEPILAEKLQRPLTPDEGAFLGKLSQIFHHYQQSGSVWTQDLMRLGFATNESRGGHYGRAFDGWWREPPRDPMELWQYIACDIESSGLALPDFMRPVTDTTAIHAWLRDRNRREAVQRWTERFKQLASTAAAPSAGRGEHLKPPQPLDLRLRVGAGSWELETRPDAAAPWKVMPRAQFDRWKDDRFGGLAGIDATPAVYAFLALCQEHYRETYSFSLDRGGFGGAALLRRLITHPLARTLVVDDGGNPLEVSDRALVWRLGRARENPADYELALELPDGVPLPPSAVHLPGQPDLYLHGRTIFRGPPPLDGTSAAAAVLPAEVVEQPATLGFLRQFGTVLPPEIEARFVNVPMRARIECALAFDFSGDEILTLQLVAVAEGPRLESKWALHGWNPVPKPHRDDPTVSDGKFYSFDLAIPNLAASRLGELRLLYDEYQKRWTKRLTRIFPEQFLAWRESLPPEVEVLATGELASLLGGPVRASIGFELIETTVHRDWFDLALALRPEDKTLTAEEIALLLKARGKLVRLPGKGWRRLRVEIEAAPAAALAASGFDAGALAEAALAGERQRLHTLQLGDADLLNLLPARQANTLRARARKLALPEPPALPAGLLADLRPYQLEGFRFLAFLSANGLGGILGDDMGLGKTLQALAWLLWLAEQRPAGKPLRALVVCPKSVVGNWETETLRFAPRLKVVPFTPAIAQTPTTPGKPGGPTIVVANYTQLRLAGEYFRAQTWDAVILDEGQFIKTPTSKVAQIARELPGEHRVILTGTPIENRLLDLWSLFSFALPGLLGAQAAFKRSYPADNPLALSRLRTRVRHFLLRRTKGQVAADLPARSEEDVMVELEGEQARLYQAELKRARAQLLNIETDRQLDRARFNILASLLRLRQICCHPGLVDSVHREASSAKLDELLERVEELRAEGHQVLVFSQFVEMLELIRERIAAAGIEHLMLTGKTENRTELIARFQADRRYTVFLLSLKAAGFGLNLTAASYVILYDPWWNPAVEAQAIDRTHRIGQTVPVNAYRYIARGTVEEKIRALQRDKASLARSIVQEESLAGVLDLESLRQILA